VVAVGGDGTANEVANGVISSKKTLGIIPTGSGNDFIKSIGIPRNTSGALECLFRDNRRLIDCGAVQCPNSGTESYRIFVNGVGIGFDAAVAERTTHIRRLSGTALYLAAVFQTLGRYKSPLFKIRLDSIAKESRNLLIAIGNGRCAGGGFYLTPDASVTDGLLDVCAIDEMSVLQILRLMPNVMKGKHMNMQGVRFSRAKEIDVSAAAKFYVHADGEIVGDQVNEVHVEIKTEALRVVGS
jgi:YegS/Rv2252/BmrU family lipid kinase